MFVHLRALWFILTHPRRFLEACRLHAELNTLERARELLEEVYTQSGLSGHNPAAVEVEAQITMVRIRIELLLDPDVDLPSKKETA